MTNAKLPATKKYVVIEKGCCFKGVTETPVDTVVSLTEKQARNKSGKVRLLTEHTILTADAEDLTKSNADLQKQVDQLTAANAELITQLTALAEDGAKLAADGETLAAANAEQSTQIEALMAKIAKTGKKSK